MHARSVSSEKKLLSQLKAGDTMAFEQLYNQYKHQLATNILGLVKDVDLAQDILQDLFVKIWENRTTLDVELSFKAYLHRIAKNRIIDLYRKSARDKMLETRLISMRAVEYSHVEETVLEKEERELILYAIEQLPPKRRLVYTLCKIEGKSYQEISEMLGISVHTVNDHIKKANILLKKLLSEPNNLLSSIVSALFCMNL